MGHKKTSRRCCECRAWYSPNTAASLTQKTCSKKCRLSQRGARAKERRAADLPAAREDERERQRRHRERTGAEGAPMSRTGLSA